MELIKNLIEIRKISDIILLISKHKQFLTYSAIGVSGATIDLVVFFILYNYIALDKNLATFISTSLGIINNFILNAVFNFKVKDNILIRFFAFYSIGFLGFLLTLIIFYLFIDLLKFNTNIVKLLSIIAVVILQYSLNKKFSFKQKQND